MGSTAHRGVGKTKGKSARTRIGHGRSPPPPCVVCALCVWCDIWEYGPYVTIDHVGIVRLMRIVCVFWRHFGREGRFVWCLCVLIELLGLFLLFS